MANRLGKVELDVWGRILMSPASNLHGGIQTRVCRALDGLGGTSIVESSVVTRVGVLVADVASASPEFMRAYSFETRYPAAPEIGVEFVSPSNSTREMKEKTVEYLAAVALEVWVVYPVDARIDVFAASGPQAATKFEIDLSGVVASLRPRR